MKIGRDSVCETTVWLPESPGFLGFFTKVRCALVRLLPEYPDRNRLEFSESSASGNGSRFP
ncbi:MAG TPA: hypothetical protein DEB39_09000 [Planctomycetaceae bacterium]|nr:hypothetical protein [Planctomycetaceae bacterium]